MIVVVLLYLKSHIMVLTVTAYKKKERHMKATGMVRKIDDLGRIVLPIELRKNLYINVKDPIEIFVDDEQHIILKKYEPACIFCGNAKDVRQIKGKNVCADCLKKIAEEKV